MNAMALVIARPGVFFGARRAFLRSRKTVGATDAKVSVTVGKAICPMRRPGPSNMRSEIGGVVTSPPWKARLPARADET